MDKKLTNLSPLFYRLSCGDKPDHVLDRKGCACTCPVCKTIYKLHPLMSRVFIIETVYPTTIEA